MVMASQRADRRVQLWYMADVLNIVAASVVKSTSICILYVIFGRAVACI